MRVAQSLAVSRPTQAAAVLTAAAAALAALVLAGSAPAAGTAQVKVAKTPLGKALIDTRGLSLYMFAADKGRTSVCYGTCAAFWPPLLTSTKHPVGTGVKSSLLGTTMRKGGKLQITYNGHPLYLFVKDKKPGQMNGQGLNVSGGLWWILSPAGIAIKHAAAKPAPTTTTTSGGGGYGGGYGSY